MGDVTEEQRKAVIEKVAIVLYGRAYVPPANVKRATAEWSNLPDDHKRCWRADATAALEAVGYFDAIDALGDVLNNLIPNLACNKCEHNCSGCDEIYPHRERIEKVLAKEAV